MSIVSRTEQAVESSRSRIGAAISDRFGILFSLPSLLYVLIVVGFPTLYLIYLSTMQDITAIAVEPTFVGLDNIMMVLTDMSYWRYFGNTIFYTVMSVGVGVILALGISVALNTDLPYQRVWQTMVILPWAIPFVVSTLMWKLMFDPNYGLINFLLLEVGLVAEPVQWFSGKWVAFTTIIVTNIWINTPLSVLILLAGLNNIPGRMYEAARVDGAGIWERFRHVTLPLLRPAIVTVLIIQTLFALRGFDIIFAMTEGGPGGATTVIGIDVYKQLVQYGNLEYAAAESLILIATIILILLILWKVLSTDYEVQT